MFGILAFVVEQNAIRIREKEFLGKRPSFEYVS